MLLKLSFLRRVRAKKRSRNYASYENTGKFICKADLKHVTGQQEMVREAEEELRKELTSFRNTVSFALLFINICFFVFAVTLKAYANELPGYKLSVPVQILVSHLRDREKILRNFRNVEELGFICEKNGR